jgi:hypothetical protein
VNNIAPFLTSYALVHCNHAELYLPAKSHLQAVSQNSSFVFIPVHKVLMMIEAMVEPVQNMVGEPMKTPRTA